MKIIEFQVPDWVNEESFKRDIKDMIGDKDSLISDIDSYEKAKLFWNIQVTDEGYNPDNTKALRALDKLMTIARVWNEIDDFEPDFGDINQYKWFPWFIFDGNGCNFVGSSRSNKTSPAGFHLCFKTGERASQFGKQFTDLFYEYLLNK